VVTFDPADGPAKVIEDHANTGPARAMNERDAGARRVGPISSEFILTFLDRLHPEVGDQTQKRRESPEAQNSAAPSSTTAAEIDGGVTIWPLDEIGPLGQGWQSTPQPP
jgi:hypothetical protein